MFLQKNMTKQEAKIQIAKLVEKYQKFLEAGKVKNFNEAQTRNEFIEPLFKYLGWDMRNENVENEVTTEESVSNGRVDLAFRFNNIPVMFLEAKAMKVDLDEWKWAEQAINYSWNKNVTWAVLTDFESIKVFNAEIPPKSVSKNLFFEIPCRDFLTRFDQLWLLSKESFELKLLDKEAEKWGKLTQRKPVSEKLFEDLMSWRILLTKDFKKQNDLATDGLDEGVQRILDRLIFIRTAEDRKIEPMTLIGISRSGKANFYKQLTKIFRDFDEGFNSKLFAPHYCEEWVASDKAIGEIIKGLYETKDGYRYDFSAISADVLGGIYEQYLSFVQVRKGEEKAKSKRKSQGIYYTPKYIVEFIVKETLGEVLKSVKSKNVGARHALPLQNIKILDPACGSGSFLNVAYDKLLEFLEKENSQTSLFDRFDILKESIFGVDLDVQAVEIAQLNLLLKVLSQRVKLPTLSHNLMAGNSLVSGEMEELESFFGENYRSLKPFDFEENFNGVFENGGFDVIVGNPPYVSFYSKQATSIDQNLMNYFLHNYDFLKNSKGKPRIGTVMLFLEKTYKLLKENGYLGLIIDLNIFEHPSVEIRKFITERMDIKKIVFGLSDFSGVGSGQCIIIAQKTKPKSKVVFYNGLDNKKVLIGNQKEWLKDESCKWEVKNAFSEILEKMEKSKFKLEDLCEVITGVAVNASQKGKEQFILNEENEKTYPLLEGSKGVSNSYSFPRSTAFLLYDKDLERKINNEFDKRYFKEKGSHQKPFNIRKIEEYDRPNNK